MRYSRSCLRLVGRIACGAALVAGSGCFFSPDRGDDSDDAAVRFDAGADSRTDFARLDLAFPDVGAEDGTWVPPVQQYAELWYSSGDKLVYVQLDRKDGTVMQVVPSTVTGMRVGQNSITMLMDGSLLLLRQISDGSEFYHVLNPPRDGAPVTPRVIGQMPDAIMIEALYTDCVGRLYGMDTGVDVGSATGNRLLLFTGDYLQGDLQYRVITDLSSASTADIDDMAPGISASGVITDNPGFAIDTGEVYDFNYQTGTGTRVGQGGRWGIHALGGPLFADGKSRLYVMNDNAEIFEMDPTTHAVSDVLATGPEVTGDVPGHSGLAGPLTNCETGFIIE